MKNCTLTKTLIKAHRRTSWIFRKVDELCEENPLRLPLGVSTVLILSFVLRIIIN